MSKIRRIIRLTRDAVGTLDELLAALLELEKAEREAGNWRDDDSPQAEKTFGVKRLLGAAA